MRFHLEARCGCGLAVHLLLVFSVFWPLVWRFSFDLRLLARIAVFAYLLFEAHEAYLLNNHSPPVRDLSSNLETTGSDIGLKIMAAIIIAFGVAVVIVGLWYAKSERSKVTEWPRTTALLVDKKFSPLGARLIFEYDVTGGRSAGRVDRYGGEEEMRAFLEPYRLGNSYPIGYNPENAPEVEFHLGYNWDLFRDSIGIVIFGALFAAAGLVLGAPWRKAVAAQAASCSMTSASGLTSRMPQTRPTDLSSFSVSQEMSNSCHIIPWRAEV